MIGEGVACRSVLVTIRAGSGSGLKARRLCRPACFEVSARTRQRLQWTGVQGHGERPMLQGTTLRRRPHSPGGHRHGQPRRALLLGAHEAQAALAHLPGGHLAGQPRAHRGVKLRLRRPARHDCEIGPKFAEVAVR